MKLKNYLFILICVLFLPIMANAKEYCKVISGNGKDIGSEIACGTEHFYIVDSNQDEVKMLAKYNLYVGNIIYKEKIEKDESDTRSDNDYCQELASSKNGYVRNDNFYNSPGYCFIEVNIQSDIVKQNEKAISAHWVNDSYEYPQIGDIYVTADTGGIYSPTGEPYTDFTVDINSSSKYDNYFFDLELANGQIPLIIQKYKEDLLTNGYDILSVNMLTLNDINNIVKKSNKSISYSDWYNHTREIAPPHFEFGTLKDYLTEDEDFLYNTTYWVRTGYDLTTNSNNMLGVDNIVFVNSNGGVCGSGVLSNLYSNAANCHYYLRLQTSLGAGLRPTITIPANELQYLIKTETSDGGSISVVDNSLGGETITFDVSTNKGFKLKGLILRTDSGEEVEFNEEDLTYNDDGTVTISKNKFIMPFENVTIEAKWELESLLVNPKTGRTLLFIGIIFITLLGLGKVFYKKRV